MARLTAVNDLDVKFTQAPDGENEILLSFQMVDSRGAPVSGRFPLHVWFTASTSTLAETGTTYSGAVTAEDGTIVRVATAKKNLECVTNADGLLTLKIVDTADTEDFAAVQAYGLNPRVFVSPAFTAYGEA
jgi:hypothetical protein